MSQSEILAEQDATFVAEDAEQPIPPPDIFAYNELRSCADLFRMFATNKLEIQPDFQRDVVWKQDEQSRFIDSLVKQLPIPSMCFSLDHKTQHWKVIDGLQRMSSIIHFLSAPVWRLSKLSDIHPKLGGVSNAELRDGDDDQKRLYSMVENVSIPITVIRCDYSQREHMSYLFTIFHRLNSGGVRLTNQEIRNCIYSSPFNDELKQFDAGNVDWKFVKKRIWGSMDRFRSIEVLLRVLAFSEKRDTYDGNLARFLNEYMHFRSTENPPVAFTEGLAETMKWAREAFGDGRQYKLSLVLVEALLVALYVNRDVLRTKSPEEIRAAYLRMREQPSFVETARYAVTSVDNVRIRLRTAIEAFQD